jgi:hypothetical protein
MRPPTNPLHPRKHTGREDFGCGYFSRMVEVCVCRKNQNA